MALGKISDDSNIPPDNITVKADPPVLDSVYQELRLLASRYMRRERRDHTLQPTALVHEAYLRLSGRKAEFQDRSHLLASAATTMRRVLVDHARHRGAKKRLINGRTELCDNTSPTDSRMRYILVLDEALDRLGQLDGRQARVVELTYFGGLTESEVAGALGISVRTVRRDWRSARAWLQLQLSGGRLPDAP